MFDWEVEEKEQCVLSKSEDRTLEIIKSGLKAIT